MQLDQLQQGLQHAFFTDRHRIVFWYDAPSHFADSLSELTLEGVQVINMAGESTLGVKLRLELEEPETLRCSTFPPPSQPRKRTGCWILSCTLVASTPTAFR